MSRGWKGLLDDFVDRRTTTGFGNNVKPVYRYCRNRGYRHRRDRNPITQKFYKDNREQKFQSRERLILEHHHKKAEEKRKFEDRSTYNIISLRDRKTNKPVEHISRAPSKRKTKHSSEQCQQDYDSLFGKAVKLSDLRSRRDYHIINNRYNENHDNKVHNLRVRKDENIRIKHGNYMKTFVDPILQTQEHMNMRKRKEAKRVNAESKMIYYKRREENDKHAEVKRFNRTKKMLERKEHVESIRSTFKEKERRRLDNRRKKRTMDRDQIWVNRGYNIMNNLPFDGLESKKPFFLPKLEKKTNIWDRLTQTM